MKYGPFIFLALLVSASAAWAQDVEFSGYYTISPMANHNFVIDVAGASTANDARVQLYTRHNGINQDFAVIPNGKGNYWIICRLSGKALDVAGGSPNDKTPIVQFRAHGSDNQLWMIQKQPNGYFLIVNVASRKVLDAAGFQDPANQNDGVQIQQYTRNDGPNQFWSFTPSQGTAQ